MYITNTKIEAKRLRVTTLAIKKLMTKCEAIEENPLLHSQYSKNE